MCYYCTSLPDQWHKSAVRYGLYKEKKLAGRGKKWMHNRDDGRGKKQKKGGN